MIEILKILLKNNRFPQSSIFNGNNLSIPIFSVKYLLCENTLKKPCDSCISCKKVDKKVHPDLFFVEVEQKAKNIKISQIREVKDFCSMTTSGKCKIVFIKQADLMSIEAQNSLLKILEEPGKNNYFILQVNNKYKLLPTILSRCIHFNLKPEKNVKISGEYLFENLKKLSFFKLYEKLKKLMEEVGDINEFLKVLVYENSENFNIEFMELLLDIENILKFNINKDSVVAKISFSIKNMEE